MVDYFGSLRIVIHNKTILKKPTDSSLLYAFYLQHEVNTTQVTLQCVKHNVAVKMFGTAKVNHIERVNSK